MGSTWSVGRYSLDRLDDCCYVMRLALFGRDLAMRCCAALSPQGLLTYAKRKAGVEK